MVKSIVTVIVSLLVLICGAIYEQIYVTNAFERLSDRVSVMQKKELDGTATVSDAKAVQDFWIKEKEKMHAFVSHNDIKELDLWLSEGVAFTKNGKFDEAFTKFAVVFDLCKSIPKGYLIRFENVF